jgi:hypothetical protein
VRAGPRGIASQFGCASATAGEATSKTATRLAVQGLILPPSARRGQAIGYSNNYAGAVLVDHAFDHLAVAAPDVPSRLSLLPCRYTCPSNSRLCLHIANAVLREHSGAHERGREKRCRVMKRRGAALKSNLSPGLNPARPSLRPAALASAVWMCAPVCRYRAAAHLCSDARVALWPHRSGFTDKCRTACRRAP